MSLTIIISNHNYASFLSKCLDSAVAFGDEVLFFDDGSTDGSLEIAEGYDIDIISRPDPSGNQMWAWNLGIEQAKCDYLHFLNSDDILFALPELVTDYVYAPIFIINERGSIVDTWRYDNWPLNGKDAIAHFLASMQPQVPYANMPMPAGGFWRTGFLRDKGLKVIEFASTRKSLDMRTHIEWAQHDPQMSYWPEPCYMWRFHDGQMSESGDREKWMEEACRIGAAL